MKTNLFLFLAALMFFLVSTMVIDFFAEGVITIKSILVSVFFFLISTVIIFAPKNSLVRWVTVILSAIIVPVMIIGLISFFSSVFSLDLADWSIMPIYIIGFIVTIYLLIRFNTKRLADFFSPTIDERNVYCIILSGLGAFIFLNFLIIGALLQPWLPIEDLRLWIGVLITGILFWIITSSILEMKY